MELFAALIGAIAGGIAGFLTSLFFWNKDRTRDAPRLVIEAKSSENYQSAIFSVRNTGFTHAEKISITVNETPEHHLLLQIDELGPDDAKQIEVLEEDETEDITLAFSDVWGRRYTSRWSIAGPEFEEIEGEKEGDLPAGRQEPFTYFEPYSVERID